MLFSKKKTSPAVSVLVPIYNTSRYLPTCLDSLIGQTLKNLEIVCINDGSTDCSLDILKEYQSRDNRIVIIDKANSGYGCSMNEGLARATGEYVGICESDDFASPKMFEKLYKYARRYNLDLVKSNYYEHDESGDRPIPAYDYLHHYKKVFSPAIYQDALTALPIIWAGLYRRDYLLANDIRFNTTPGASYQDTSFVHQCWFAAQRAALLPDYFLHYRVDNAASSCNQTSKIFEVCGEYALSESYLARNPKLESTFAPILNFLKYGTYRWNFNRIAPEYRRDFATRWASEYSEAATKGCLDLSYFPPESRMQVELLMHDLDAFMEHYGDGL